MEFNVAPLIIGMPSATFLTASGKRPQTIIAWRRSRAFITVHMQNVYWIMNMSTVECAHPGSPCCYKRAGCHSKERELPCTAAAAAADSVGGNKGWGCGV